MTTQSLLRGTVALVICLAVSAIVQGQTAPDLRWTSQFGTGPTWDRATGIAVTADAVYLCGSVDAPSGKPDAFLRKLDRDGNLLWMRSFGATDFARAFGVATDASGVYVVGETYAALPGQTNPRGFDAFVRKYDALGNELWTREFGFPAAPGYIAADHATAVYVDDSGVYIAGWTETDSRDAFIAKYDSSGAPRWLARFGSTATQDLATGISGTASGVYLVGTTADHGFIRKYDKYSADPVVTWDVFTYLLPTAVSAAPTGIYVAGTVSIGSRDAGVAKFDDQGTNAWTRVFGTWANDEAHAVFASDAAIYVTGFAGAALPGQIAADSRDVFVRKYEPLGNEVWTYQFGTAGWDEADAIAADGSAIFVGGSSPDAATPDGFDAFAARLDELPLVTVAIDIKPGAIPNSINLGSGGTIPVAILSSATFDARTVDPASIELAGAAVALKGRGTLMADVQDVNGDGLADYVVHVATDALELNDSDTAAILRARTWDGTLIRGSDTVRILP